MYERGRVCTHQNTCMRTHACDLFYLSLLLTNGNLHIQYPIFFLTCPIISIFLTCPIETKFCFHTCTRTLTPPCPLTYQATLARPLPSFLSRYLMLYTSVTHTRLAISNLARSSIFCNGVLQCVDTSKLQRG